MKVNTDHTPDVVILMLCLPRQDHKNDDVSDVGDAQQVGKYGKDTGGFFMLELVLGSKPHQENADYIACDGTSDHLADQVLPIR